MSAGETFGALSTQLEQWLSGEGEKTLGALVHTFREKSFAILLVLLLGVPALPLPTGGVTHVFELIAAIVFGLLALAGTVGAFFAPPFSGLDTLPAVGVVVLALGVLLEDALVALVGIALGTAGVVLELALGAAAVHGISPIL